jgi:hypothetical protein
MLLQMRQEQMNAFAAASRRRFEDRIVAYIDEAYPEETFDLTDTDLRNRTHKAVEKAISYGIETENDVVEFVELNFELGDDFDTNPAYAWVSDILRQPHQNGRRKIMEIQERLDQVEDAPENNPSHSDGEDEDTDNSEAWDWPEEVG